jgi:hypothetical protein
MTREDNDESEPAPARPKRPEPAIFTHKAFAFRRIGKKWGVYREVGVARVPPCEHCGAPSTGKVKIFVDRMIAFGGATGGFLLTANDVTPPRLERDFPEQKEFDEKEILPEG